MSEINKEQIQQVIDYLEWKAGKKLPLKILFALIYLADRAHLRKHGDLIIGRHSLSFPEGYYIVDVNLPPINFEVAHMLGLHPEDKERFLIELDLDR